MHKKEFKSTVTILVSAVLLLGCIGWYQKETESHLGAEVTENLNYLPSGTFLKGMALGYDEAFADFLWVRTVGYFGAHVKTDRDFTWLTHMLKLTAELDPRYDSPYEFAGVVLPSELNKVDEGMAFLEAGIRNIPKNNPRYWLQPFYLGFCYMIYKDNPLKAAQYFELASGYPQSPGYLPLLVSRLYASADKPSVGMDILQSLLKAQKSSNMKPKISFDNAIKKRIQELVVAQYINIIENAVMEYIAIFQQRPSELSDLVDGMILPFILEDPFGGHYFLSLNGKQVLSTKSEGKFVIYSDRDSLP